MNDTDKLPELGDFTDLVGERFVFSLPGHPDQQVEGELIKAMAVKHEPAPGATRAPFVLEFKFPEGANIGQCVLEARTASGTTFPPMLLVPRGDQGGWFMDANFN